MLNFDMYPPNSLIGRTAIVLTASDRCHLGQQQDVSGPALATVLVQAGAQVLDRILVPDDLDTIAGALRTAASRAQLILTTGGTGLAPRDITPEATLRVADRLVPGLAELIRQDGLRHTPFAALSRGVAAIVGTSLVINLPGSPQGAVSSLEGVLHLLPHALDLLAGHTEHKPTA
jgi:molybdenum cofactor synthesis domain-containing protein